MTVLLSLVTAAAAAAAPQSAPAITLSPAAKQDVRCFVLAALATNEAGDDAKLKQAGSLGLLYFIGKLQVEAPGLNMAAAVRQEADAMDSEGKAKEVGQACDIEFTKRGAELRNLGQELQAKAAAKPSP